MSSFIADHHIWDEEQRDAAAQLRRGSGLGDLQLVRLAWGDQHGLTRVKTVTVNEFKNVLDRGRPFQLAPVLLDTADNPAISPLSSKASFGVRELEGFPDGVLVPDPRTFRVVPWNRTTGLVLCDLHLQTGSAMPFCTRQLLRRKLDALASTGFEYRIGLEIEFYVFRLVDDRLNYSSLGSGPPPPPPPPVVAPLVHGRQYLGEHAVDQLDTVASLVRETAENLGLPLATVEVETGPGHLECTFDVLDASTASDAALLFRTGIKQAAWRAGYHVSFMPRPQLDGVDSSGWHVHQSIAGGSRNLFANSDDPDGLSDEGRSFLGGLLTHAQEASLLVAPLVNSYKRYEPGSFAPWSACWTKETRGSLVRVLGGGHQDRTRLEFRGGDSSANPYLYVVSQLISGFDGMKKRLDPGPPEMEPSASQAPVLPRSLLDAVDAFEASSLFRDALGDLFVDYLVTIKRQEVDRFLASVTDWEQREYFRSF